ncbi:diaminobutyrate--2-oxoglutarate transaminase [Bradyrhizobium sp. DOA9]|uniref:diaminobutyrate--2-oxoglutarate transaminase n=1 Tax=Bradyrhizobium sp. DOA9 TaxID=1126627 RepID=UPI000468291A|nr:diaminobutyrate--2-oxoglutarate transaminase [Bradyrhizobium sp. DOA9]GAJ37702.1 probable aminotransferase Y4QG [Bradyrhizobium sp. DOA9]
MTESVRSSRNLHALNAMESNVRLYSRAFPALFSHARGSFLLTETGDRFIDFLSGAGALNYGHNNHQIKAAMTAYLASDAVVHGLDMATPAKLAFMETFSSVILRERRLSYRFQFTGPTGANAVEAALKLARKVTGRHNIISFTRGYHGLSLGAAAATGNQFYRKASQVALSGVTFMPFDGYLGEGIDAAEYLRNALRDPSSGIDAPAAILLETIQGEGGINVAREPWLRSIQTIAAEIEAVFIVDDIQMGCGRTGDFFSFESAELSPDIVILSKSLSGYGLPLSLLLIKDAIDIWEPGEHTGTFRGNNLALVSATAALNLYWRSAAFSQSIHQMGTLMRQRLNAISAAQGNRFTVRGRGMALGFDCGKTPEIAAVAVRTAYNRGLIIERCGPADEVIKFFPSLTIDPETLNRGLDIFEESLAEAMSQSSAALT